MSIKVTLIPGEVVADLYARLGFSVSSDPNVWFRSVSQQPDDLVSYIKYKSPVKGKTGAFTQADLSQ